MLNPTVNAMSNATSSATKFKGIAIIVSRFNEEVTTGLLQGAQAFLTEKKVEIRPGDIYYAPGAFEIPLLAKKLAKSGKYSGIICLGCVIKGDTAHFEFISLGATLGIQQTILECEVPISFGILTTYSEGQALERSHPNASNKGREAASACLEMIGLIRIIDSL